MSCLIKIIKRASRAKKLAKTILAESDGSSKAKRALLAPIMPGLLSRDPSGTRRMRSPHLRTLLPPLLEKPAVEPPPPDLPAKVPREPRPPAGTVADPNTAVSPPPDEEPAAPLPVGGEFFFALFSSEGSLAFALAADKAENAAVSSFLLLPYGAPPPLPPAPPALPPRAAELLEKMPLGKKLFLLPFVPAPAAAAPVPPPSARGVRISVLINASKAAGSGDAAAAAVPSPVPCAPEDAPPPPAESPAVVTAVSAGTAAAVVVVASSPPPSPPPPFILSWEEVLLRREDVATEVEAVPGSSSGPPAAPLEPPSPV